MFVFVSNCELLEKREHICGNWLCLIWLSFSHCHENKQLLCICLFIIIALPFLLAPGNLVQNFTVMCKNQWNKCITTFFSWPLLCILFAFYLVFKSTNISYFYSIYIFEEWLVIHIKNTVILFKFSQTWKSNHIFQGRGHLASCPGFVSSFPSPCLPIPFVPSLPFPSSPLC